MTDLEDEFLSELEAEHKEILEFEKRREFFKTIGKIGGQKKKKSAVLDKIVVVRFRQKDLNVVRQKAKNAKISLSKYIRLVSTDSELKINEYLLDAQLLCFGNSFKRITNLIRNSSFSEFENRQKLMHETEELVREIKSYLYNKLIQKENE